MNLVSTCGSGPVFLESVLFIILLNNIVYKYHGFSNLFILLFYCCKKFDFIIYFR